LGILITTSLVSVITTSIYMFFFTDAPQKIGYAWTWCSVAFGCTALFIALYYNLYVRKRKPTDRNPPSP
jgi:hypothetical protein